MAIKFYKYHGLGNDYIIIDPADGVHELTTIEIVRICHRNYGIGSDGILLGPIDSEDGIAAVRIFNPDGSEAEKSGNGLRIFARYLWDKGVVSDAPFFISTIGGSVNATILDNGKRIRIEMGTVSFNSARIPVTGPDREVINEKITIDGHEFNFCAATIGNPHCVILQDEITPETACRIGPKIETHALFPNRINVQFLKVIDRSNIQIEIWERGAGYTLASGSSSCAAAAVAHKLGLCGPNITVHMPGGQLAIHIEKDFYVTLTGPVVKVAEGFLDAEMFENS
jgi:diaminopimelate epimerase